MNARASNLQILRRERHPLVALATLAFTLRLCLLVLASALSAEAAAASGLTSLCQPSGLEQTQSAGHDLLTCHCGPVCAHGCTLAPAFAAASPEPRGRSFSGRSFDFPAAGVTFRHESSRSAPIRAPPLALS